MKNTHKVCLSQNEVDTHIQKSDFHVTLKHEHFLFYSIYGHYQSRLPSANENTDHNLVHDQKQVPDSVWNTTFLWEQDNLVHDKEMSARFCMKQHFSGNSSKNRSQIMYWTQPSSGT